MVDLGICHYMTVFKTPDGKFVQFDFGPLGGDVQVANGPLAKLLQRARRDAAAAGVTTTAAAARTNNSIQPAAVAAAVAVAASSHSSSSRGGGMQYSLSYPVLPIASLELAANGGMGEWRNEPMDAIPLCSTSSSSSSSNEGGGLQLGKRR
jgi:hypothetical protein